MEALGGGGTLGGGGCARSGGGGGEDAVKVLYEDLCEDVDGRERPQWRGAVSRPHHVHPEHTGQVGRAHLVDQALLGHLWREGV